MSNDEQLIRTLIADWLEATRAGNLPKILSLMAEDVVFLTPGQPPMRGRDAFAAAFQAMLPQPQIDSTAQVQEIQIVGDLAYCWTQLTVTVTPLTGGLPKQLAGYTLTILRKQSAGNWVITRDANLLSAAS